MMSYAYVFEILEPRPRWDWNGLLFNGTCCYLGFPCSYNPKNSVSRFGYATILFGALIFVTVMNYGIILFVVTPYLNPQIQTIQEIIDGQFNLIGDQFTMWKVMEQNKIYPRESLTKFKIVEHPSEYFGQLELNDRIAVAASFEDSRSKPRDFRFGPKMSIHCFDFDNIIYEHSLKMLTRKGFPHLNDLNDFLQRASESGLIDKWLKAYRLVREEKSKVEYVTVKAEILLVALVIYSCMNLMAFLIIFVERKTFQKARSANAAPFWRYLEIVIDPYRYLFLQKVDWKK
ncbi:uncharacterized protein LOC116351666 [Contarinia nasturtii]|uniref:uncharacterized protein LOC116351666 n=1 Tax=Contarinia nasturtii TaxID=265458 RepID=UPI0012D49385|nr:uncharacterized protein LOC116351666 [Contarinia nasturtii]